MSNKDTSPPRPKRRILFRLFRGFLVFVVLIIVTYIVADQVMLRKVQQKREAFKERFGAVDFRDFIPERPAPEEDAGRVYLYAAGLMSQVNAEYGDWSAFSALTKGPEAFRKRGQQDEELPPPDEIEGRVRVKLAAMEEAFQKVEEAQSLPRGSAAEEIDFETPPFELSAPRELARNLAAKAIFDARSGDLDGACRWLEAGLRMAATMNEDPTLLALLVRIACVETSLIAAENVMNTTDAMLPLGEPYSKLLKIVTDPEVYRKNLASEAAFCLSREMPLLRLFMSANNSKLIEFWFATDDALALEPRSARRAQLDALDTRGGAGAFFSPFNWVVPLMGPAIIGNIEGFDRMAARCDFMYVATQLRAWKVQHGSYPDTLDALASAAPLPLDPFSGAAYHYRREGDGFVLYSVGPNRKDDGGVKDEKRDEGDIVWTCGR
jgi:hypothetical protein